MARAHGFGGGGFPRSHRYGSMRIGVVVLFCCMSAIAIGVPLLSKPAAVAPVPVAPTAIPLVDVWIPTQRINAGTLLTPLMFKKERLPEGALQGLSGRAIRSELELAGRYARAVIMPGKPITSEQLMDTPDGQITRKIRPGFRAVTVELTRVSGIEGWGTPGTKVDVMWFSGSDNGGQFVTTIVRGAQILSVAGKTVVQNSVKEMVPAALANRAAQSSSEVVAESPVQDKVFTVTLLVTPEDGQKIFLASRSGELSLMLHGDFDGPQDAGKASPFTAKRLAEGVGDQTDRAERVEGVAKARRPDGSVDEWSVIEGRVWRWDQGQDPTSIE